MAAADRAQLYGGDAREGASELRNRRAENAEELRRRTRIALGMITLAIAAAAVSDMFFLRWQRPVIHLTQLVLLIVVIALHAALRRAAVEHVVRVAALTACGLYIAIAATSTLTGDDLITPLELTTIAVGTASLLPWGTLPQLVTVVVAAAALVGNILLVRGGLDLQATYTALVATAMAFSASVYIANKLARARRRTEETERQRNEAERALRAAHAELEQRVAQRTAELQVANHALEKENAERKQLEEAARQHQAQLAQATRLSSVGQMAVEMAHELNQPLGAIANYAQGCARYLQSNTASTADLIDAVEQIAEQALRAGSIIRRMASVARKPDTLPERMHLNDLVRGVARLMGAETQQLGFTLHLDLAAQLPVVQVDRLQIEEVMVNLIRNGCEAMDGCRGARDLSITTSAASPAAVAVTVRDTGRGLAPGIAARIFEPFYTTKPHGLGLGLSISRSIVEAHGGDLQAISTIDRGTAFQVTLPAAPPDA